MITIVIADDHEIVRSGIKLILEKDPQVKVIDEAADGSQAYASVAKNHPDILLLDISMPPGQSGLAACEEIARDFSDTKIIILTMYAEPEYLFHTIRCGASGYIPKNASAPDLRTAIYSVAEGGNYIHPTMTSLLAEHVASGNTNDYANLQSLTAREIEILQLLAHGYTNREISEKVFLSVKTIEMHRARIYSKLNIKTRADLVTFALKHKLLDVQI